MISLHGVRSKKVSKQVKVKQMMATKQIMNEAITNTVAEATRVAIQAMAEAWAE